MIRFPTKELEWIEWSSVQVTLLLSCTLTVLITANVRGAAIETSPDAIALDHLSPADQEYLTYLEQELIRKKRSEDIFSLLKAKVAQNIKSKVGHVASASSHASHGKKDHTEQYHHHYGPPPEHHHHEEEKSFDFWDLQKSILNTLLQAVKAIKGGLIAIKGHLIKGGGYIISAKGKLISAKGEAITNLGKHIASSAHLIPHKHKHSHSSEESEVPEHEYIHHVPSGVGYAEPSGHGHGHEIDLHSSHHHSSPPLSGYSDHKFPPSLEDNHESSLSHYKFHPHMFEHAGNNHDVKHTAPPATNYGTPIGLPDHSEYLNKVRLLNSFQNTHSTGGLSDYQTKLEAYEPLGLPSSVSTPLAGGGLSSLGSHGYQQFPSYPVDLSQNFGAQHSLLEPSPDSETSDTQHEIILTARVPSKGLRNLHRFPAMIVTSDSFKDFLLAQQRSRNRQSSYNRSISRRKRPKSYERNGRTA
ncbi:hypothetical protein ILUMI_24575 [Ignelater luminosus]|uniref:Uncharacterized protein n=1 Tax=Ignelater luminosus TaxID=2038154 RepID=A0A8K0C609_IGNLU|nr:hypothetical protein ILUMI_24575 [Ignelater luminosus]